ncbi:hypothetical protein DEAC_c44110 [Desulfosporosinus acididurans]|uniref:Transcriptional coactivator p15 (PC4) C-terminal domain-containing protein n=1 Tax=Desulfosporosinus acididurans TaxID=476652 RepID=A0A0J1FJR6_9FIRM|nr:hypothetical protein DEAC_c44110 [Desulfosporosinus acididurans]
MAYFDIVRRTLPAGLSDLVDWVKGMTFWNDKELKYDIREWSSDHSKMGKGVTLTSEELKTLRDMQVGLLI